MTIISLHAAEPVGKFPHAKRAGDLLFLSGIGPREPGASVIPGVEPHDIAAQYHSVLRNVRAILAEAGTDLRSLVDVTVFLTDMKRDFAAYNRLWAETFPDGAPCRTTVEVGSLPTPIAIEWKCVAWLGARPAGEPR